MPRGGARPNSGPKPGRSAIARRTAKLLDELHADPTLKPPLRILWEAANDRLCARDDSPIEVPLDLRIKAATAAAALSHARPPTDDPDKDRLRTIAFVMVLDDSEQAQLKPPALDGEFEELAEAAD